jgi:aminoglycoside phosphotransferase (APT) family kinase protein
MGAHPDVIAKRCRAGEAHVEHAVYRDVLPSTGAATVDYFGSVADTDDEFAWVFVEDAAGDRYTPESAVHRDLAARFLGQLHAAAAPLAGTVALPDRGPVHYRACLDTVRDELGGLDASDASFSAGELRVLESLRRLTAELDDRWSDVAAAASTWRPTLVHGSFSHRNMRVRDDRLLVFDWGAAGWGPPARDVAKLVGARIGGDATRYRQALAAHGSPVDDAPVQGVVALGGLFRGVEHLSWALPKLRDEWRDGVIETIERHGRSIRGCASLLEQSHA